MTQYDRGVALEYRVAEKLEAAGYVAVRSAGSHGSADVVGLRAGTTPLLVQCKISGTLGPEEWNKAWAKAQQAGGLPLVAYRPTPRTVGFKLMLAPKTGVKGVRSPWTDWRLE